MTETTPELLPCPFCGPGNSICDPWFDDVSKRWRVGCGRCGASTGTHPRDTGKEVAIAAWNSRHNAQAEQIEQAIIDRLNGVPPKVWTLTVRYGRYYDEELLSIHSTKRGALAKLTAYCREQWNATEIGRELPTDDSEARQAYFDLYKDEEYFINTVNIED